MDNYSVLVFEIEIEIHSVIEVLCIILIILSWDGMNKKGFDVKWTNFMNIINSWESVH